MVFSPFSTATAFAGDSSEVPVAQVLKPEIPSGYLTDVRSRICCRKRVDLAPCEPKTDGQIDELYEVGHSHLKILKQQPGLKTK